MPWANGPGRLPGVVGDANDADDAFQATFLLLIRKAGSLWVRDSLGVGSIAWLAGLPSRLNPT